MINGASKAMGKQIEGMEELRRVRSGPELWEPPEQLAEGGGVCFCTSLIIRLIARSIESTIEVNTDEEALVP